MIGLQNEREWTKFCNIVLEMPQLIDDRRFSANTDRSMNRGALRDLIQSIFNKQSTEELIDKLRSADIAYANVNDMDKVWNHEQLRKLNRFIVTDTPEGEVPTFLPPTNNSEFDPAISPVPALGQHSKQILGELGFSNNEIKAFQENKVI